MLAESKPLSLSLKAARKLPQTEADPGLLGEALSVLLTNAFNYTPPGGEVVIGTRTRKKGSQRWVGFSVGDTGPGILSDEQPRLFERFFRGEAGRTSGAPGTGLGLAIAKEIVELHHGLIEVESAGIPGQGATFTIWLPAADR